MKWKWSENEVNMKWNWNEGLADFDGMQNNKNIGNIISTIGCRCLYFILVFLSFWLFVPVSILVMFGLFLLLQRHQFLCHEKALIFDQFTSTAHIFILGWSVLSTRDINGCRKCWHMLWTWTKPTSSARFEVNISRISHRIEREHQWVRCTLRYIISTSGAWRVHWRSPQRLFCYRINRWSEFS